MKNLIINYYYSALYFLSDVGKPRNIVGFLIFLAPFTMGILQTYSGPLYFWILLSKYYVYICWVCALLLFMFQINRVIFHKRRLKSSYTVAILLYALSFFTSMYFSPGYSNFTNFTLGKADFVGVLIELILKLPLQLALLYLIYITISSKDDLLYCINTFVTSGIVVNSITILIFLSGFTEKGRLGGPFHDPNYLGRFEVFMIVISLSLLLFSKISNLKRNLHIINIICCLIILYFTFSRGSILTLVAASSTIILFVRKRYIKFFVIGAILFASAFMLTYVALRRGAGSGGLGLLASFVDLSNFIRLVINISAFNMFLDYPIFGVGYSNFYNVYYNGFYTLPGLPVYFFVTYIHSWLFNVLAEQGLFGTLPLCFLLFVTFKDLIKSIKIPPDNEIRMIGIILFGLFLSFVFFELFYPDFYDELMLPLLGGLIGSYFVVGNFPHVKNRKNLLA
ncbi:MAG: O-antigen ligase family protein [Ignavibacteriae bacterium]|nr:O-antigen ligase family protein [Ignavibacteriota bacterium]